MIRLSPLKLQKYFVDELTVAVRLLKTNAPVLDLELTPDDLEVGVEQYEGVEKQSHKLCHLTVKLKETDKQVPYRFFIRMVGLFELDPTGMSQQQIETHLRFSMPSVLWSAAREVLATQMAKGPFPPVLLPVVTFLPEQEPLDKLKGVGTALGAHQVP